VPERYRLLFFWFLFNGVFWRWFVVLTWTTSLPVTANENKEPRKKKGERTRRRVQLLGVEDKLLVLYAEVLIPCVLIGPFFGKFSKINCQICGTSFKKSTMKGFVKKEKNQPFL